ncbi:hypothetical protein BP6252_11407 [Coleophoma cylindrospora]|uniref:Heterokaryon incompatibility domain-containing protein n=1 Tax=Coleophoma cylindrospora TaxID=1849047 RepID=A0A3D8QKL3_9HELO|nr:hypothetical protein BP6252_11407 [Coleophoma cylindrospora]
MDYLKSAIDDFTSASVGLGVRLLFSRYIWMRFVFADTQPLPSNAFLILLACLWLHRASSEIHQLCSRHTRGFRLPPEQGWLVKIFLDQAMVLLGYLVYARIIFPALERLIPFSRMIWIAIVELLYIFFNGWVSPQPHLQMLHSLDQHVHSALQNLAEKFRAVCFLDTSNVDEQPKEGYKHSAILQRQIRLIRVRRRPFRTDIECELVVRDLDAVGPFYAISYAWGNVLPLQDILINGKGYKVTKSAFNVLHAVGDRFASKYFWLDSISINQEDTAEKTAQVRLMTDIYRKASATVVYLGSTGYLRGVESTMNNLSTLRSDKRSYRPEAMGAFSFLQGRNAPGYSQAVQALYSLPWFQRAWVLQEVAVAREVFFMWGTEFLSWKTLLSGAQDVMQYSVDPADVMIRSGLNTESIAFAETWIGHINSLGKLASNIQSATAVHTMKTVQGSIFSHQSPSLLELLRQTHASASTDPRDKIYALLGLADPKSLNSIEVDYVTTPKDIYISAARRILSGGSSTDIILSAGIGVPRKMLDLPSWVPDWSCYPGPLLESIMTTIKNPEVKLAKELSESEILNPYLVTPGSEIDSIRTFSSTISEIEHKLKLQTSHLSAILYWIAEAIKFSNSHNLAFTQDDSHLQKSSPGKPREARDAFDSQLLWRTILGRDFLLENKNILQKSSIKKTLEAGLAELTLNLDSDLNKICMRVYRRCWARRLCITEQNKISLVPEGAWVGDGIWLLANLSSPVLLRKYKPLGVEQNTTATLGQYLLVGQCTYDFVGGVAIDRVIVIR